MLSLYAPYHMTCELREINHILEFLILIRLFTKQFLWHSEKENNSYLRTLYFFLYQSGYGSKF